MIKQLTLLIIEAIKQHGSASVFWGGIIEQIISPIPSVLIPMSAGFLLIPKHLYFFPAVIQILSKISLPYAFGASLGSSVLYFLSFFGGRPLLEKYGRFFDLSLKKIEKFKARFTRGFKDELLIFLLLIIPVTPISLMAVSCGLIGISAAEFYPLIFAGTFVRSIFLGILGWKLGETYELIATGLNKTESLISAAIILVCLLALAFLYYKREKFFNNA